MRLIEKATETQRKWWPKDEKKTIIPSGYRIVLDSRKEGREEITQENGYRSDRTQYACSEDCTNKIKNQISPKRISNPEAG